MKSERPKVLFIFHFSPFYIHSPMQNSLSRYLVIYTVAQLPMLVIAAFFPYIFSMDTSPNMRALLRALLDYVPFLILAAFLWHDMSAARRVSPFGLVLTATCGFTGYLMQRTGLPLVRKYGCVTIVYTLLLLVSIYFFPTYTNLLTIAFQILTLILVLSDLSRLPLSRNPATAWLTALLIITCFAQPFVAILALLLLHHAEHTNNAVAALKTYLLPIALISLAKRICAALPVSLTLFGFPTSVILSTLLGLILLVIIIVMLYRDAPKARLSRFWLCASAIGSAPVSALCCLFAQQENKEEE